MSDVNEAWNYLFNQILLEANMTCPLTTFKFKRDRPPWYNDELRDLSVNRDYIYKVATRSGDPTDFEHARFLRNQVNSRIKSAKADYFMTKLNETKSDSKKFWCTIKEILPDHKSSSIHTVINLDTDQMCNPNDTANIINSFFSTIGEKLANNFPVSGYTVNPGLPECSFELKPDITPNTVNKLVKDVKITKSSGCKYISSRLYKDAFCVLPEQLCHVFNLSIKTSEFPVMWKNTIVTPIPKKGNTEYVTNIRPISLIHLGGKLLEKVVNEKLMKYLEDNKLLSDNQFGFRKGHSTTQSYLLFIGKNEQIHQCQ